MAAILLIAAISLLVVALVVLELLFKAQGWRNLHKVWDLAVQGSRMARIYVALIGLAFLLAVVSQALRIAELREGKSKSVASHLQLPNHSLEWRALGWPRAATQLKR